MTLFVRVMDREDVAVRFFVLRDKVTLARVTAEATRIDRQHVDAGLAFDDPFGQLPAGTTRGRDAEAVAFVDPDVPDAPRRPDQRAAIGRVRDWTVDDVLDAATLQPRHATLRRFDVGQQPLQFAGKEVLAEPARHAVGEARRRAGFVGTEDPAQAFLAEVIRLIGLAQHREFAAARLAICLQLGRFIVDDVLVFDRNGRHFKAEHAARLPGVVAGAKHDMLGGDFTAVRRELPFAARQSAPRRSLQSVR